MAAPVSRPPTPTKRPSTDEGRRDQLSAILTAILSGGGNGDPYQNEQSMFANKPAAAPAAAAAPVANPPVPTPRPEPPAAAGNAVMPARAPVPQMRPPDPDPYPGAANGPPQPAPMAMPANPPVPARRPGTTQVSMNRPRNPLQMLGGRGLLGLPQRMIG